MNQLASQTPFFETHGDGETPPNGQRERGLISWVPPPSAMRSSSTATPSPAIYGDLPLRMVNNPEPNLRPTSPGNMPREYSSSRGRSEGNGKW